MHPPLRLAALLAIALASPRNALAQGSLTPPGPPAPTMKTLSQIEPRTDIAELAGNANAVKVIPGPGHYYLTGNLAAVSGKDGIRVNSAGGVTIDLNGFTITVSNGRSGIVVPGTIVPGDNDGVVIRNGTILANADSSTQAINASCRHAVCENLKILGAGGGIFGAQALGLGAYAIVSRCNIQHGNVSAQAGSILRDTVIEGGAFDLFVSLSGGNGLLSNVTITAATCTVQMGNNSVASDCSITVGGNSPALINGTVIQAGDGAVLRNCTVNAGTTSGSAISVGNGSLVTGCRITSTFRDGINSSSSKNVTVESCVFQNFGRVGIRLGTNARVRDCTVVASATSSTNGMELGDKAVVSGCSVSGCQSAGIQAADAAVISGCIVSENGATGITAGNISVVSDSTARSNQAAGISVGTGSSLSDCVAAGNTTDGIVAGHGTTLSNCSAITNLGRGIAAGDSSTLVNCIANSNQGIAGISGGFGSSLTNCSARANTSSATSSFGISVSSESTLVGCTVTNTNSAATTATATTGGGISAGTASTVKDCTVQGSRGDGILAAANCHIVGNTCNGNGSGSGDGAGIHTTGTRNRIERNTVTTNDRGIEVSSTSSLIIGNDASGNTLNFSIAASNRYGAIVDLTAVGSAAVNGNAAASTIGTADSTFNISH